MVGFISETVIYRIAEPVRLVALKLAGMAKSPAIDKHIKRYIDQTPVPHGCVARLTCYATLHYVGYGRSLHIHFQLSLHRLASGDTCLSTLFSFSWSS